jgi:hypothetical protein
MKSHIHFLSKYTSLRYLVEKHPTPRKNKEKGEENPDGRTPCRVIDFDKTVFEQLPKHCLLTFDCF